MKSTSANFLINISGFFALTMLVLFILYYGLLYLDDYPYFYIATSNIEGDVAYKINGKLAEPTTGICALVSTKQPKIVIELLSTGKSQIAIIKENLLGKHSIQIDGDNLGLNIIRANSNPKLRKEFGCSG